MHSTQFYSPDKQRNLFVNKRELFRLGENSFDFKFSEHQEQKKISHGHATVNIKSQIVNLKCLEKNLLFVATEELKKMARAKVACVSERYFFFVRCVEIVKASDHQLIPQLDSAQSKS